MVGALVRRDVVVRACGVGFGRGRGVVVVDAAGWCWVAARRSASILDVGAAEHLLFAELPVHALAGSPGPAHLVGDALPHVFHEPSCWRKSALVVVGGGGGVS